MRIYLLSAAILVAAFGISVYGNAQSSRPAISLGTSTNRLNVVGASQTGPYLTTEGSVVNLASYIEARITDRHYRFVVVASKINGCCGDESEEILKRYTYPANFVKKGRSDIEQAEFDMNHLPNGTNAIRFGIEEETVVEYESQWDYATMKRFRLANPPS
jgi:hypothetical protein